MKLSRRQLILELRAGACLGNDAQIIPVRRQVAAQAAAMLAEERPEEDSFFELVIKVLALLVIIPAIGLALIFLWQTLLVQLGFAHY